MARLGSVLGAILAELARARVVADHLSRDLVDEYRADPILASMSVPRVLLGEAELTLRFSVSDVTEAAVAPPAGASTIQPWIRNIATSILPAALERHALSEAEREAVLARLVGSRDAPSTKIPATVIRDALAGKIASAVRATADAVLASWTGLPREIRAKVGSKSAFRRDLEDRLSAEMPSWIARAGELELIRAALASRVDIAIRTPELASDPQKVQELKLTLRGEDLSLIVESGSGA